MSALPRGSVVGSYRVERVLGVGGFGITYLCVDSTRRYVAVKEFFPREFVHREGTELRITNEQDLPECNSFLRNFYKESLILEAVSGHPNIVNVFDVFSDNNTYYMVMEYIDGTSLQKYISEKQLNYDEFRDLFLQILSALKVVHEVGILHRDISLLNIMMAKGFRKPRPILIDFGASGFESQRERSSLPIANKYYAPPEQLSLDDYERVHGPYTDIFAVGVIMYRIITGRRPPDVVSRLMGSPDSYSPLAQSNVLPRTYPYEVLRAVDAALELKADRRPQSVNEFISLLGWVLSSEDKTLPLKTREELQIENSKKKRTKYKEYLYISWLLIMTVMLISLIGWAIIGALKKAGRCETSAICTFFN